MLWQFDSKHPHIVDVVLVALLIPLTLGEAGRHASSWPVAIAVTLAATLPLLLRRRSPTGVLVAVTAATIGGQAVVHSSLQFPVSLAVYTVAANLPRRISWRAAALAVILTSVPPPGFKSWAPPITAVAAWIVGDTLRSRRAFLQEERDQGARRAAADEQARIARELHDVIAHNVSVMVVQAAAANDVFDTHPDKARDALRSIEETGRSALTELRRLLGVVHTSGDDAYAPQPGLSGLDELVERVRAAGLPVELHVQGDVADLPAGLGLSAFRIVQEALTNTLKHGHASRAEVGVRRTPSTVELEIVDDGVGGEAATADGRGLIGMRERASLVGGEVDAGPLPGRGFRVRARLPLEDA